MRPCCSGVVDGFNRREVFRRARKSNERGPLGSLCTTRASRRGRQGPFSRISRARATGRCGNGTTGAGICSVPRCGNAGRRQSTRRRSGSRDGSGTWGWPWSVPKGCRRGSRPPGRRSRPFRSSAPQCGCARTSPRSAWIVGPDAGAPSSAQASRGGTRRSGNGPPGSGDSRLQAAGQGTLEAVAPQRGGG